MKTLLNLTHHYAEREPNGDLKISPVNRRSTAHDPSRGFPEATGSPVTIPKEDLAKLVSFIEGRDTAEHISFQKTV